jgi:uncharacterized protein (TIGR02996 family)
MNANDSEPPTPLQRAVVPPIERDFLDALLANPGDDALRLVYADWLEEHGQHRRAEFVRLQCTLATATEEEAATMEELGRSLAPASDAWWRAVTGRPPIEKCEVRFAFACPKRWSALTPTSDPNARHCSTCEREVHFCATLVDVLARGRDGACVAFDAGLVRSEALDAYRAGQEEDHEMLLGEIAIDPEDPG